MKKYLRFLPIALALVICFSLVPLSASAEGSYTKLNVGQSYSGLYVWSPSTGGRINDWSAFSCPVPGMSMSVSTDTIYISGTPTSTGIYTVSTVVDCTNEGGTVTMTFEVVCANHNWELSFSAPGGCTYSGSAAYTCKNCGATKEETLPASGHDWGSWSVSKAATETSKGEEIRSCSRCTVTETREIPMLTKTECTHSWGSWQVKTAATETKDGEEVRTCSKCTKTESRVIAATGAKSCVITKHPAGESIKEGESTMFTASAENYKSVYWVLVKGSSVVNANDAKSTFSGLSVSTYTAKSGKNVIELYNIPSTLSGWAAQAVYTGNDGKTVSTNSATITVSSSKPVTPVTPVPVTPKPSDTPAPTATPEPSKAPEPSATPEPTPTAEATPAPTPEPVKNEKSGIPGWAILLIIIGLAAIGIGGYALFVLPAQREAQRAAEAKKKRRASGIVCDKCGWICTTPDDIPHFCPNCGDPIDANDIRRKKKKTTEE